MKKAPTEMLANGKRDYFKGIKECPRCYGRLADTVKWEATNDEADQYYVQCPNCRQEGPVESTAPKALRAWNTDSNFREPIK